MAKRLTDSEKWSRKWFADLPPMAKLTWLYVLDECDNCGVWHSNFKRMTADLDLAITPQQFDAWFGTKVMKLDDDKYFISSFIEFQYGKLSIDNRAHRPVINFLDRFSIDLETLRRPIDAPTVGAKDKDKDKDKDMEKDTGKEKEQAIDFEPKLAAIRQPPESAAALYEAWGKTLAKYKINKDPKLDAHNILRLAKAHGFEKTRLALIGAGFEPQSESYNPAAHCNIMRLVNDAKIFEKFVNLGAQKAATAPELPKVAIIEDHGRADPSLVAGTVAGILKSLKGA